MPFNISSLLPLKKSSVPVGPGATALTEISFLDRSLDMTLTIWSMAPFVAQYSKYGGATVDAKFTVVERRTTCDPAAMCGAAAYSNRSTQRQPL
jgi:hypothetical protein